MKSDVSVVVTCYNYGRYLSGALRSALAQSLPPREIIVVNDGSTDDTEAVMASFRGEPLVRGITQPNGGQANAKNNGVKASSGAFVAFLDADDAWTPDKLEKQMPLFKNPDVGVVFSRQTIVDDDNRPMPHANRLPVFRGRVFRELLKDNFVPFSSSVVRRSCFEAAGGFDETLPMSIDWDLWLRIGARHAFDYVEAPLLFYRAGHPGQMSKNLMKRMECCDRIYAKVEKELAGAYTPAELRDARIYTFNHRGYYFRGKNPVLARRYYRDSLRLSPFQWAAWKGAVLSLLPLQGENA